MFPSLLVQPEVTVLSPYVAYVILSFGIVIARFKKLVAAVALLAIILASPQAKAFAYIGGGCGTFCMNQQQQWGYPMFFPGAYMYPYLAAPWMFYGNMSAYYSMMPPWYYGTPPFVRQGGIQ